MLLTTPWWCLPQPPLLRSLCCDVVISNIHSAGRGKFQWALPCKLLHKLRAVSFDPGPCDPRALSLENYSREDECIKEKRHPGPPSHSISSIVPNECVPESSATINGRSESLINKIRELYYNYIQRFRNAQRHCEREGSRWLGLEWSSARYIFQIKRLGSGAITANAWPEC